VSAVKKLPSRRTLDGTLERAASLARRGVPTRDAMYGHQGAYAAPRPQFVERSASQKVRRRRRRRRRVVVVNLKQNAWMVFQRLTNETYAFVCAPPNTAS